MRINCGATWEEKKAVLKEWHDFYAIFPRRVGSRDCRCFEIIERRGEIYWKYSITGIKLPYWSWEYRAKDSA